MTPVPAISQESAFESLPLDTIGNVFNEFFRKHHSRLTPEEPPDTIGLDYVGRHRCFELTRADEYDK